MIPKQTFFHFRGHLHSIDWSHLLNMLNGQMEPVQIVIRLSCTELEEHEKFVLEEAFRFCDSLLAENDKKSDIFLHVPKIQNLLLQQLQELQKAAFRVGVFMLSENPISETLANILGKSITQTSGNLSHNEMFVGGFVCRAIHPDQVIDTRWFSHSDLLTIQEAACAFRLPGPPSADLTILSVRRHRSVPAILPVSYPATGDITLFVNEHQGMTQSIQMNTEDRMRHMFIVGQTGTGKSTLMESLILLYIVSGKGMAVIDPHGDMVDSILGKIPASRVDDVIVFDLLKKNRPLGFNRIEWKNIDDRDIIIDDLYQNLDRLYDFKTTGGPMFEKYFRGMLGLLMGDKPRPGFIPTLLDFVHCFESEDFRKWLKNDITDAHLKTMLKEIENAGGEASMNNVSPYITSKFSRFTSDSRLKRIVGQSRSSLNFESIMNDGRILLVKLGRGRFGSTISALIANQIVSRFKLAAMKRGDIPVSQRKEFYLYVDECQTLPPENFMELLSEARKYRMGLVLATQYTAQLAGGLGGGNNLLSAIIGNVGSMIIFRLGQHDAELMDQALKPVLNQQDITGLPNFQGYASMQLFGEMTRPFSFQTRKNTMGYDPHIADAILKNNRSRYGMAVEKIDRQIYDRLNTYESLLPEQTEMFPSVLNIVRDTIKKIENERKPAKLNLNISDCMDVPLSNMFEDMLSEKSLELLSDNGFNSVGDIVNSTHRDAMRIRLGSVISEIREVFMDEFDYPVWQKE